MGPYSKDLGHRLTSFKDVFRLSSARPSGPVDSSKAAASSKALASADKGSAEMAMRLIRPALTFWVKSMVNNSIFISCSRFLGRNNQ